MYPDLMHIMFSNLVLFLCCLPIVSSNNCQKSNKKLRRIQQQLVDMGKKIDDMYEIIKDNGKMRYDCQDIQEKNIEPDLESGVFAIKVSGYPRKNVYCNFTNNESWTTISRRIHEMNIFNRTWNEYAKGFGKGKGDYWLGNDIIHELTSTHKYKLRISMEGFRIKGNKAYSVYDSFRIGSRNLSYPLRLGKYLSDQSNGGDSFHPTARCNETSNHDMTFSTPDYGVSSSCARKLSGGWWFTNCGCSNLNGEVIHGRLVTDPNIKTGMYWDTLYYDRWEMKSPLRGVVMEISRE
ncbi:ficolin-1-A-like [Argonauta hians]